MNSIALTPPGCKDANVQIVDDNFSKLAAKGITSRRRDCHFAALPSPFSRRFDRDEEGASAK